MDLMKTPSGKNRKTNPLKTNMSMNKLFRTVNSAIIVELKKTFRAAVAAPYPPMGCSLSPA
jgi:hypothetical protein